LRAWEVPGVAVAVVDRERVLWLKGYGVRELGADRPVTPDTVFPLASCTKAFTATLTAMLADDGKLTWDDPVRQHWPPFRLADRRRGAGPGDAAPGRPRRQAGAGRVVRAAPAQPGRLGPRRRPRPDRLAAIPARRRHVPRPAAGVGRQPRRDAHAAGGAAPGG